MAFHIKSHWPGVHSFSKWKQSKCFKWNIVCLCVCVSSTSMTLSLVHFLYFINRYGGLIGRPCFFIRDVSPTLLWRGQKYNLASSPHWLEHLVSIRTHTVIVLLLSSLFPFKDCSFGCKSPNKGTRQKCNITFPPASHLLPLCNSDSFVIKQKTNVGTCQKLCITQFPGGKLCDTQFLLY